MKKLSLFVFLFIASFPLSAQRIENVRFEQSGKMINIYYDLVSTDPAQRFQIKLYASFDGGSTWTGPLSLVTGNVGNDQTAGSNKKITWDVLSERDKLVGNVMFEVRASFLAGGSGSGTFTDGRDGRVYKYVTIGRQVWMAENLAYLPAVSSPKEGSTSSPFYYVYKYTGSSVSAAKATGNYKTYGVLYNWPAAMSGAKSSDANPSGVQGVCPDGWHLPGDAEWKQLEMFLGMSQAEADGTGYRGTDEGGKLKENGTTHWNSPNTGAANSNGFTALPGGYRFSYGYFYYMGYLAYFWSSTEGDSYLAWGRRLDYGSSEVYRYDYYKEYGFSVRCLRDFVRTEGD